MKLVVQNKELREKMKEAINILCNNVKTTLGPKGCNVIINNSNFSPFITNDGVTIAENIESDDKVVNAILEIAKEASIKTNENVGDGTTTTLVLLQSIFNNGLKIIEEGTNPIMLKKELDNAIEFIIEKIKNKSRIPNDEELLNIACVSANDKEIGKIVGEAYLKVRDKSAVIIKESNENETQINYLKGYILESNLASKYFLKDLKELVLEKTKILLIDGYLDNINYLAKILNEIIAKNENLIVIANDYDEIVVNEIVSLNFDNNINVILLKNPEYGMRQLSILKDINAISGARILEKLDYLDMNDVGIIDNIKITAEQVIMSYHETKILRLRVNEIKKEMISIKDSMEIEFYKKRLAMFNNGSIEILVGDKTTAARREKKMRFDDSLCAVDSSSSGVLPGCGIVLLSISDELENENIGYEIFKKALKVPFEQIMYNAGINYDNTLRDIQNKNYNILYNLNNQKYEDIKNTEILDPTKVVINALTLANSIASMLLTTTSIVINERENELNKINDFNEL